MNKSGLPSVGIGGEGAQRPPAFTCPIHPNCSEEQVEIGRVPFLNRSALACWWSITYLMRSAGDCYLWTFTCAEVVPDHWFANMHSNLVRNVRNDSRSGIFPVNWGGVRVFEIHPGGHGLHAHWVMRGRMDWYAMQDCALRAGLGKIVHVAPRPCTPASAFYLASYLNKQEEKMHGCRKWANIGTYDGIGKRDIVMESERITSIKQWQAHFRVEGWHRFLAYKMAVEKVDKGLTCPGFEPF